MSDVLDNLNTYPANNETDNDNNLTEIKIETNNTPLLHVELPNAKPIVAEEKIEVYKNWNGDLCGCFNNMYPSMFCSFLLPNIYVPLMINKITKKSSGYYLLATYLLLNLFSYSTYTYAKSTSLLIHYLSNLMMLYAALVVRSTIRKENKIPGSNCEDTFVTFFCTPCSIAQTGRTIYEHDKICDSM